MIEESATSTEDVGVLLDRSAMADSASYGLEYFLLGKRDARVLELLRAGKELCENLLAACSDVPDALRTEEDYRKYLTLDAFLPPSAKPESMKDSLAPHRERFEKLRQGLENVMFAIEKGQTEPTNDEVKELQRILSSISERYLKEAAPRIRKLDEAFFER